MAAEPIPIPALATPEEDMTSLDLPVASLTPLQKRPVKRAVMNRLEANIRAVGLIEPLLVYRHDDGQHYILDGYLRYQVLLHIGQPTAPCLILKTLDLYTPNRQVNFLGRAQRWKMLETALPFVGEEALKSALDLREVKRGFSPTQKAALCHEVQEREQRGELSKVACYHLVHVTPDRQREILDVADKADDHSSAFIRAQVLRTPINQRVQSSNGRSPWNKGAEVRKKLVDRLIEAERRHDFYQGLYRQYSHDLIRLATYVRQIVTSKPLRDSLVQHHPEALELFKGLLEQCGEDPGIK